MRVLVATTAGAGHWVGLVPFARALVAAGHDVRVAAPASFASAVTRAGFVHAPFADADPGELGAVFGGFPSLTNREANRTVIAEVFGRIDARAALPGLEALVDDWRPDVVVREPGEMASYAVARGRGVPQVQVNAGIDRFQDGMLELLDEPLRELGVADGAQGLRDVPRWTTLPESFDVPATVVAEPPARFRGFEAYGDAAPLPDWWGGRDGPLVYVTFGSVAAGLGLFPTFYARVLESLADAEVRVLMTLGEAGDVEALGTLPANVHVERWWPQDQVMPHTQVIVGHGGFGTTVQSLASGIPQVVVPLFAGDQFDNATRVAAVGAGLDLQLPDADSRLTVDMIPAGPPVVEELPDAVQRALHDEDIGRAARAVADEMAALPPVEDCAAALATVAEGTHDRDVAPT
jgi:UDP:flavonoid glycosyltransferase YjiC (YdhE family)